MENFSVGSDLFISRTILNSKTIKHTIFIITFLTRRKHLWNYHSVFSWLSLFLFLCLKSILEKSDDSLGDFPLLFGDMCLPGRKSIDAEETKMWEENWNTISECKKIIKIEIKGASRRHCSAGYLFYFTLWSVTPVVNCSCEILDPFFVCVVKIRHCLGRPTMTQASSGHLQLPSGFFPSTVAPPHRYVIGRDVSGGGILFLECLGRFLK